MVSCDAIIEALTKWFGDSTTIEVSGNTCYVDLPLERPDSDLIRLSITEDDEVFTISDDGSCFEYLFLTGVDYKRSTQNKVDIKVLLNTYNVETDFSELYVECTKENLPRSLFNLLQAYNGICYLQYRVREAMLKEFKVDVKEYLYQNQIVYEPEYEIEGTSSKHKIHFNIPINGTGILLHTLRANDIYVARSISQRTAFHWVDLKRKWEEKFGYFTVFDDTVENVEDVWAPDIVNILTTYSDHTFKWSNKGELIEKINESY